MEKDKTTEHYELTKKLHGTTNAIIWAEEFVKIIKKNPSIPVDEGFMIGWFANAMMTAHDHAKRDLIRQLKMR